ncbi:MAG TPA: hypothetical protein VLW65_03135 [Bryobacteraceae bacterium]|nr:hypothetical protein [Bryobacteraceae bacterium]
MFLFDWFRSLLPLHNPIGFGAADFIALALAVLLVLAVLARTRLEPLALRLTRNTLWTMLLLGALPIVLRLALLPRFPAPTPSGADDFSYLLLADTLRHFRLANPMHPMRQFFEAVFIVQQPTYGSIFPLGQGIALALGWMIFGHPWAGVLISMGALGAACYWMLRGWTTPGWALAGGLLAVCEFGPLNRWMNLYWGGAVSAIAGCLVFGALPRLKSNGRRLDAVLLGAGLGLELLTRPFEFVLLLACVVVGQVVNLRAGCQPAPGRVTNPPQVTNLAHKFAIAAPAFLPFVLLTLAQNYAVTGSFTTLPYQLSRYQYGVPTTFTIQPNPVPHLPLTAEQQLDYRAQSIIHGESTDTPSEWMARFIDRIHFYRFFFYPPIYLVLPVFLMALVEWRFAWLAGTVALFAIAENFYPYFYAHYIAALTCVFLLITVTALERVSRWSPLAARVVLYLCAAHFVFWYGLFCGSEPLLMTAGRYDTADFINYGDPESRIRINQELAGTAGKKLVFVRYGPQHMFHEWIHNAADIDSADVVWAADLGDTADRQLRAYYPSRSVWLVEPDAKPPRLIPYH